jgi:hypothetical protein
MSTVEIITQETNLEIVTGMQGPPGPPGPGGGIAWEDLPGPIGGFLKRITETTAEWVLEIDGGNAGVVPPTVDLDGGLYNTVFTLFTDGGTPSTNTFDQTYEGGAP